VGTVSRHDEEGAARADDTDHLEILLRVVARAPEHVDVGGVGRGGGQHQGVTVGWCCLDRQHADDAIGARLVLDDERLAGLVLDVLADQAGGDVARAAGRERHDDSDRFAGPGAGLGQCIGNKSRNGGENGR
jgi:hypothetical protein